MNLFELFVKIGVDDQASRKISTITQKLGNGLKTAAKIGTAAVTVAAAGITALTKASIDQYAEYEQLVGGVETLFKDSAGKVQQYAADAYKTAGMSANDYMSTVTSFSASLLQSLEGDTEAAAEYANQALVDMSDNANKMGTSMESIQNAYQGFAKANYTMLDNLKLGYGGTKEEMQRLIADAAALSDTVDEQIMSFANIVEAIHVVQTEMGITGTTAAEAASTISGSAASMKAAWDNLLTGISDGNADMETLISNLVSSVSTFMGNLMPTVETALNGTVTMIETLFPVIMDSLPSIIENTLPKIASSAVSIVETFVKGIGDNADTITDSAIEIIMILTTGLLNLLPEIISVGLDLLIALAMGIADALPELTPTIIDVILKIVEVLTNPDTLSNLAIAALEIIKQLAFGLVDAIPALIDATFTIIDNIVTMLTDPSTLPMLFEAAFTIVTSLGLGLIEAVPKLVQSAEQLIKKFVKKFIEFDWVQLGKDILAGIGNGLKAGYEFVSEKIGGAVDWIFDLFKKETDSHSPSRRSAREVGLPIMQGIAVGFEDGAYAAESSMVSTLRDVGVTLAETASSVGTSIANAFSSSLSSGMSSGVAGAMSGVLGNLTSQPWSTSGFLAGFGIDASTVDPSKILLNGVPLSEMPEGVSVVDAREILEKAGANIYGSMRDAMKNGGGLFYDENGGIGRVEGDGNLFGTIRGRSFVNVTQNIYSEAKTAADLMEEALYQQQKAVTMGV